MLDTLAKQFVPALNQNYRYHPGSRLLEFDDGTVYTLREAMLLREANDEVLVAVHKVKRVFNGEVINENDEKTFLLFGRAP